MRFVLVATLLLTACGESPTAARALVLTASAGNGQTGTVAHPVPVAPAVTVTSNSQPLAGVEVTFTLPPERDLFTDSIFTYHAVVVTDATGTARFDNWTLGTSVGVYSLTASAVGAAPITFTATALPWTVFGCLKSAGDAQTAPAGSALTTMPAVKVIDAFGNGVPGVSVFFTVTGGGGSITGATSLTGTDGVARLGGWTLGSAPGNNTLTALLIGNGAPGIPLTFTETGVAPAAARR